MPTLRSDAPRAFGPEGVDRGIGQHTDPILDSINEGVFTVDLDWRITSFNRAAETITGIQREEAIGQRCREVFRASICEDACVLREALRTEKSAFGATVYVVDARGIRIPIEISAAVLRDQHGRVVGGVETFQDLRQVEELRKRLFGRHTFADIVGKSPAMAQLFELLPKVADSESTVLVRGASGTGKELVARAIHELSPRRKRRFVAVNCGALPDTLLESELFGYKAGAFTDAKRDKLGRFSQADGGTIFLDEIGDVSPAMQVRLLRVLQERTFEPLGSVEPMRANVRVIAATHRDLGQLMRAGSFREDLFYRIHVFRLDLAPLKDRREDIPLLIDHFIGKLNALYGRDVPGLSREAFSILMEHDFPGNVREIQNILEHAFVLCHSGLIQPYHLPAHLKSKAAHGLPICDSGTDLKSIERLVISEALRRHGGNRALAAKELGIDPSTLYRKIRLFRIDTPARDGRGRSRRSLP